MEKAGLKTMMESLLHEVEEEDIGISLLTTFYQDQCELAFFKPADREKVCRILKVLSDDSRRHKEILFKLIGILEGLYHAQ